MAEAVRFWTLQFFGEVAIEFTLRQLSDKALPNSNDEKVVQFVCQNACLLSFVSRPD